MDIVVIARDTWGGVWRRRQFLAAEFARENRVLFVEAPLSLPRLLTGSPDMTQRPRNRRWQFVSPPLRAQENLFVTAPLKPFPNHPEAFAGINRQLFIAHVRRCCRSLDFHKPILWINPEYAWFLPDAIEHSLVIYDITDDWVHAASLPEREAREIHDNDRRMTAAADIVFTVSHDLYAKKKDTHTHVFYMPNGVHPDLYAIDSAPLPRELENIPRPIAGYTGSLHTDRLDLDLIEWISRNSNFSQVFVGPDCLDCAARARLNQLERVFLIPPQPLERLPAFTHHFDVCHIPHVINDFTNSLDPIKAYEYLATGRPIVSVSLRGLAHLEEFVAMAGNDQGYLELLEDSIRGREKSSLESRRAQARRHSWTSRAEQIFNHIQHMLPVEKQPQSKMAGS